MSRSASNPGRRLSRGALSSFVLAGVLLALTGVSEGRAALPVDAVDFVIVTTEALEPEFARLAAVRTAEGLATRVVTVEWITANVAPGRDLPETVRNFLVQAHADWGLRYVLLGGDHTLLPPRFAFCLYYPSSVGSFIPADLYFGGLDGDWDADGDSIFGEADFSFDDFADLAAELAVGRAPVSTPAEAAVFVDKTLAFSAPVDEPAADGALMLGEVLFWKDAAETDPWTDGATFCEAIRDSLTATADPPWRVSRLYEYYGAYPGSVPLTAAAALDSMGAGGHRLVEHVGVAWCDSFSAGPGWVRAEDLEALSDGSDGYLFNSWMCVSAAIDSSCLIGRLMNDPDGGCVGGVGAAKPNFPNVASLFMYGFYGQAVSGAAPRIGDAMIAMRAPWLGSSTYDNIFRYETLVLNLLGDPTMTLVRPLTPPPDLFVDGGSIRFTADYETAVGDPVTIRVPVANRGGRDAEAVVDVACEYPPDTRLPIGTAAVQAPAPPAPGVVDTVWLSFPWTVAAAACVIHVTVRDVVPEDSDVGNNVAVCDFALGGVIGNQSVRLVAEDRPEGLVLSWSSRPEVDAFVLERRTDGSSWWDPLAVVPVRWDDGNGYADYAYLDADVETDLLYRYRLLGRANGYGDFLLGAVEAVHVVQAMAGPALRGAHPNPFNPSTTIAYAVGRAQRVVIRIYGLDGRRVATLVEREHGPGAYATAWEGRDDRGRPMPSGPYLVRVETEEGWESTKITLIR